MPRNLRKRIVLTQLACVVAYSAFCVGVQLAMANVYVWTIAG